MVLEATSDDNRLGAYAVRDDRAQTLNLLLINKDPTRSLNVSVNAEGLRFGGAADVYSYGIPQDEAAHTGTGLADVAQTSVTTTGPTITYTSAPYSATVIRLRASEMCNRHRDDHVGFR